jgi:GAF domain-containing protein/anti-sigma regulatory factor (Ser/Thr protein kinase)
MTVTGGSGDVISHGPSVLPERFELEVEAQPRSVPLIRHAVSAFAAEQGAEEGAVASIALAVTEAVTNAVVHAYVGRDPGTVLVIAEPARDALVVRVVDTGRGMGPRPDSPGLGLGMPTIGRLTTSCEVRQGPGGGTELRMVFDALGVRGPHRPITPGDDADDRERFELLSSVARLSEDGGWPGQGIERLVDLFVPRVADVCAVEVLDEGSTPRRVALRCAETLEEPVREWLAEEAPAIAALREGAAQVVELDEARLGLGWWVSVPLGGGERALGALGFGLRPSRGRPEGARLDFLALLGERAASGLANSRLIDELRSTRRRLERMLDALAEAITVHGADNQIIYANDAAVRLLGGSSVEEVLAARPGELAARFIISREDGSPVGFGDLPGPRLVAGEQVEPLLTRSVDRATGVARWLLTKTTLLDDGGRFAVNIIEDVTEAKDAERRQRFLARAASVLASSLDYEQTLEHVARLAVPDLADWCAVDLFDEDGALQRLGLAHVDPAKLALGREMQRRWPPDLETDTGLAGVLRDGRSAIYPEVTEEMLVAAVKDPEQLAMLRELGMRSAMLVPMRLGERTIGSLTFVTAESARAFTPEDLAFAEDLAQRAAVAVENARLYAAARRGG